MSAHQNYSYTGVRYRKILLGFPNHHREALEKRRGGEELEGACRLQRGSQTYSNRYVTSIVYFR